MRRHLGHVGIFLGHTAYTLSIYVTYQVKVVSLIPVKHQIDAVAHKSQIYTDVELVLLLIGQLRVGQRHQRQTGLLRICFQTPRLIGLIDGVGIAHTTGTALGSQRVAGTYLSVCERVRASAPSLEEWLLVSIPRSRNVPRRQPAALTALSHLVRALITDCSVDDITTCVTIARRSYICEVTRIRGTHAVVVAVLLFHLFEKLVAGKWQIALTIDNTISVKGLGHTVHLTGLHSSHYIEDVVVTECLLILRRSAEVILRHLIQSVEPESTLWQHRLRQCVGHVGIGVEIAVTASHGRILRFYTGTVRKRLVRTFFHIVILLTRTVTICSQQVNLQALNRTDIKFTLELQVGHGYIYIVLLQLVKDIKRTVISLVVRIGVKRTRCVQRVAVGVDVERAIHLHVHHVGVLAQRTRSALLAVAVARKNLNAHLVGKVIIRVGVESVTLHTTRLVPSRIVHQRHRCVEVTLVGSATHAHSMVLHDVVVEQQVKPVGVAELCLSQI